MRTCTFLLCYLLIPLAVPATPALKVGVSIAPQKFLVERIGGDRVSVEVLLQPGASPETFDPTVRQLQRLSTMDLYFAIGLAFEQAWLAGFGNRSGTRVVPCCGDILPRRAGRVDNHVWTSARNLVSLAARIRDTLVEIDPQHAELYTRNFHQLSAELQSLDTEIQRRLDGRRTDYFIISHGALGHFADDYGLVQLALESDGREPGIKGLIRLIEQARRENIRLLLVQKQHPDASALALAREINADTVEIDPLEGDAISNLRRISDLIAAATR